MEYEHLISRQQMIIPEEIQNKIKKCRILFLGCGLGSQIAMLAVRMGFTDFIFFDGDKIEDNNLNRQAFDSSFIGKNKAKSLSLMVTGINDGVNIECHEYFLKDEAEASEVIDRSDIIINMADPSRIMYFVNSYSQKQDKLVVFPLNVIWCSCVLFFTKQSATLEEILGRDFPTGSDFYIRLIERIIPDLPAELAEFYIKNQENLSKIKFIPQLGITSLVGASVSLTGIVKWLSGDQFKKSPNPVFIDLIDSLVKKR